MQLKTIIIGIMMLLIMIQVTTATENINWSETIWWSTAEFAQFTDDDVWQIYVGRFQEVVGDEIAVDFVYKTNHTHLWYNESSDETRIYLVETPIRIEMDVEVAYNCINYGNIQTCANTIFSGTEPYTFQGEDNETYTLQPIAHNGIETLNELYDYSIDLRDKSASLAAYIDVIDFLEGIEMDDIHPGDTPGMMASATSDIKDNPINIFQRIGKWFRGET